MKQNIYLMRHGETLFNKKNIMQGASDSPLTDLGVSQSNVAAKYFQENNIQIDSAYSSTSERASDTLEYVLGDSFPYKRVKGIKEKNFGLFEGEYGKMVPNPRPFKDFFHHFGGEKDEEFRTRIENSMHNIAENDNNKDILIVAHGVLMVEFLKINKEHSEFKRKTDGINNCSIFHYVYDGSHFKLQEVIQHDFSEVIE